jgi:hypothetical protein
MTKRQRREHKIGNQRRKKMILHLARHAEKPARAYWATAMIPQNGRYS